MPRKRSFDEDALLDAAIELFWVKGFRAASLPELSAGTGVGNGSLYQAFGSKADLFAAAFRRYCGRRVALVAAVVSGPHDGVAALLEDFYEAIIADCVRYGDRRGCLMLNTIAELGSDAEVVRIASATVEDMERAVARALADVCDRDADDASIAVAAGHAIALSQALIHLSRLDRSRQELQRIGHHAAAATELTLRAA